MWVKLEADLNAEELSLVLTIFKLKLKVVNSSQIFYQVYSNSINSDKSVYWKELWVLFCFYTEFLQTMPCFSSQALGKWELIPVKWIVKYANILVAGKPWKLIRKLQLMDFTGMWQKADYSEGGRQGEQHSALAINRSTHSCGRFKVHHYFYLVIYLTVSFLL